MKQKSLQTDSQLESLSETHQMLQKKNKRNQQELENCSLRLTNLLIEKEMTYEENRDLRKENQELKEKMLEIEDKNKTLMESNEKMEKENCQQVENQQKSLKLLEEHTTKYHQNLKTFQFSLEQLRKTKVEKEGKIKSQDEEITSLKEFCRKLQSQNESLNTKLAMFGGEVKNLEEEIADQERQMTLLRKTTEDKLKSQKEEIIFIKESSRKILEDKNIEVKKLEEDKEDLQQKLLSQEENLNKLKSVAKDQNAGRAKRKRLEDKVKILKNIMIKIKRKQHSELVDALKIYR